ncbi:MAG: 50S ribosomal protein L4 [Patescibacteria group bacterium]|nr:50S ribosomal protein L4 [Patescibacteria group bacterium]
MPRKTVSKKIENKETENKLITEVFNAEGKVVGDVVLDPRIFGATINEELITQALRTYQANQRQGTADTKTRAEVRGGGRKPWRQKGTGRARQGSIRAPHWRGGGIIFGPQPKDWEAKMPKKARRAALISALSAKQAEKAVVVLDTLEIKEAKTKKIAQILKNLPLKKKILMVLPKRDELILRASRNLPKVKLALPSDLNTYEVTASENLVLPKETLKNMEDFFFKSKKEEDKKE